MTYGGSPPNNKENKTIYLKIAIFDKAISGAFHLLSVFPQTSVLSEIIFHPTLDGRCRSHWLAYRARCGEVDARKFLTVFLKRAPDEWDSLNLGTRGL